jgi:glutathione S-transferase
MRLIGMPDSPYVRRVGISLALMNLPFSHERLSVFRNYDEFSVINPVVKAPTLVLDEGKVLMDSTLILEYLDRIAPAGRRLTPDSLDEHVRGQRVIGLALVACEKTLQGVYERDFRPAEKQHQPWIDRVQGQLRAAYRLLEAELGNGRAWLLGARPFQADVTAAVAWRFTQGALADLIKPKDYPALSRFSERAESLDAFRAVPFEC